MKECKPSYYAVLPANIRYDKKINTNAKLLFAEISALCNYKGTCFASNAYFAKLYDVDPRTIQRWLTSLQNSCYININHQSNGGSNLRVISLNISLVGQNCHPMTEMSPPMTKVSPPHDKSVTHNNNINNNIYTTKSIYPSSTSDIEDDGQIDEEIKEEKIEDKELTYFKELVLEELEKGKCEFVEQIRSIVDEIEKKEFLNINGNKIRVAEYYKELLTILRAVDCNDKINDVLCAVDVKKDVKNKFNYIVSSLYNKCKMMSFE